MKRFVTLGILAILLFGTMCVTAMQDPVSVKTTPGNSVRIYAWPNEIGQLLTMKDGIANSSGIFEWTFFTLNVPTVRYQIIVLSPSEESIHNEDFPNQGISAPMRFDCTGETCLIVSEEEFFGSVENETVEAKVSEVIVENETVEGVSRLRSFILTGKAIFMDEDGSINWVYSIGSGGAFVVIIVFLLMMFHRGGEKKVGVVRVKDEDEIELEDMEKKVKDKAEEIRLVKEKRSRKEKIEIAKRKLEEEELELKRLRGMDSDHPAVARQREVVNEQRREVQNAQEESNS